MTGGSIKGQWPIRNSDPWSAFVRRPSGRAPSVRFGRAASGNDPSMTDIGPRGPVHPGDSVEFRPDDPWYTRAQRWITHHKVVVASLAVALVLSGVGVVAGSYYFESVPTPDQL